LRFLLSAFPISAFHPPSRALAAETLNLERTLSDIVNQAYGLTRAEIALMWQTAPPRLRIKGPKTGQNLPVDARRRV
jgi:hypothetical protein